jgi:hypothetical protein
LDEEIDVGDEDEVGGNIEDENDDQEGSKADA